MDEEQEGRFHEIQQGFQESIFELILAQVGDREDAEVLTKETFLDAHRVFLRLKPNTNVENWLRNMAENNCHYYFERKRLHTEDETKA